MKIMTVKGIIAVLLAAIMMFGLVACGNQEQPIGSESSSIMEDSKEPIQTATENIQATEQTEPREEWGVTDKYSASNEKGSASFYISFPAYTGIVKGTGLIANQADDTIVIVDRQQVDISPDVDNVESVLPTYVDQIVKILKAYYSLRGDNYEFSVESQEKVTINGYEMCKYVGEHSFTYERNSRTCKFVAYATTLKSNGAYVYWMVLDDSEDQSMYDTIEEYAYKMAESLWEEN